MQAQAAKRLRSEIDALARGNVAEPHDAKLAALMAENARLQYQLDTLTQVCVGPDACLCSCPYSWSECCLGL